MEIISCWFFFFFCLDFSKNPLCPWLKREEKNNKNQSLSFKNFKILCTYVLPISLDANYSYQNNYCLHADYLPFQNHLLTWSLLSYLTLVHYRHAQSWFISWFRGYGSHRIFWITLYCWEYRHWAIQFSTESWFSFLFSLLFIPLALCF